MQRGQRTLWPDNKEARQTCSDFSSTQSRSRNELYTRNAIAAENLLLMYIALT